MPLARRICPIFLLLSAMSVLLCGCWDRREIEERTSVVAVGIDTVQGHKELIEVSVQIPIPIRIAGSGGAGTGGGNGKTVQVESARGRTVLDAMKNLQKKLNQQLFYGHTRVIAISEDAARLGVNSLFDPFRRDPEIRRLLWLLVIKGKAFDALNINPNLEQIPTVYIMTMIENGSKAGTITDVNLGQFFIKLTTDGRQPFLNYFQVKAGSLRWNGIALFRDDQMVGTLNDEQSWSLLRLAEKKNGSNITYNYDNDPAKKVTLSMDYLRRREKISYKNDQVQVHIRVDMESNLLEKTFDSNLFKASEIKKLEQGAEVYLEKNAMSLIQALQKTYRTDALGIGARVRAFHPEIWKKVNWNEAFTEANITVDFRVNLRNTGMEMQ
ncbi:Ger(x)C family germination protein [Paenibacillus phyllosphaerae]|uniref:Ger(X)C family germination protein n=1 Tax=Paenibacillus phyllosphaerae TaxID=274593 RepID=A0A7W5B592_9BACL|nr:Ger(x)C family spore germination protein [Paenibacillus phyllosphaerae]MBB3114512.1 Ger(x)C family germination protein [Paenibacillus phyllosphaerae]